MGWAQKLPSGRYRAMYRDPAGRKLGAGVYDSKPVAIQAATRAEGVARNEPEVLATLTVSEWGEHWWGMRVVAPATRDNDERRWKNHILPKWGGFSLDAINRGMVQGWVAELSNSGLSPATVQKVVMLLSASFTAAEGAGRVRGNPCRRLSLPTPEPTPDRFLTDPEVEAVTNLLQGVDRLMWQLLLGTGLRWGEAAGLHWEHVHLRSNMIEVRYSYDRVSRSFKSPKSHQSRDVPISKTLSISLAERLKSVGYGDVPKLAYRGSTARTGLVFANSAGGVYDASTFARNLSAAGRAATFEDNGAMRKVGHIRPHDARHTYASRLVQKDVDLYRVQKLLGHANITETERYARFGANRWDTVRAALDS